MDDADSLSAYLPFLFGGIPVTLGVTTLSMVIAVPMSFILALGRLSSQRFLRWPACMFIELFRGSSAIVQLFWAFYVLPFFGINLSPLVAGVLVLGFNSGSFLSEVVRAGLNGVPNGQREAALTLGLSARYRFFRIILPQALPIMIPPFGNSLITMLKFSSLVSLVTIQDLAFRANLISTSLGESSQVYVIVMAIYFTLALILAAFARWLEAMVNRRSGRDSAGSTDQPHAVPDWALGLSR